MRCLNSSNSPVAVEFFGLFDLEACLCMLLQVPVSATVHSTVFFRGPAVSSPMPLPTVDDMNPKSSKGFRVFGFRVLGFRV